MKKLLSFVLCVTMLFSFVACGQENTKEPNPNALNTLKDYVKENGQHYDFDDQLIFFISSDESTPNHMSAFGNLRCSIKYKLDEDIIEFTVACDCSSFPYSWHLNNNNEISASYLNCNIEIKNDLDKYDYHCSIDLNKVEDVYPSYWVNGYIYAPTSSEDEITIVKTDVNTLYMNEDDELTELLLNNYSLKAIKFIKSYLEFLNIGVSLYDLGFTSFK